MVQKQKSFKKKKKNQTEKPGKRRKRDKRTELINKEKENINSFRPNDLILTTLRRKGSHTASLSEKFLVKWSPTTLQHKKGQKPNF